MRFIYLLGMFGGIPLVALSIYLAVRG